jgi:hypothetical protein
MINNSWVGYLDRSYQQIKTALLTRLGVVAPEISDHSSSNLLVIIIEMFAGVVEHLNYYIDNMAREAFIATARRYDSHIKIAKLHDYRVRAANPSSADLQLTFNTPSTFAAVIPIHTEFSTQSGIIFRSIANTPVPAGSAGVNLAVKQWVKKNSILLGVTDGSSNQAFQIESGYCNETMVIKVGGVSYTRVYTFGYSNALDKHFIVEVDTDGQAYVVFGDNTNGAIPASGKNVRGNYYVTSGDIGNVDAGNISTLITTLAIPGVTTITVTNPAAASAGFLYETIELMKTRIPLSIRTLLRAVTFQDYIDIAKLYAGVGKATVYYNCGKYVYIYIVPVGGGSASNALLADVVIWFEDKRMVTTFIQCRAAGETVLRLTLEVRSRFQEDPLDAKTDVETALLDFGSYQKQDINKAVRLSDIYALVDNLEKVSFVNITHLSTLPYANPINHSTQLNWTREVLNGTTRSFWKAEYIDLAGVHKYRLFKDNLYLGDVDEGLVYTDPTNTIKLQFTGGIYTHGMQWEFVTYPINQDIVIDDFTIPKVELSFVNVNVTPTYTEDI